ncbi:hypothetical protein [Paracoccus siganidrum]|uniref:DNA-binding protein n=1 Tax=Paracoccus siganidrum TaxID=1276757 RepID=A0A419A4G8_9RHOB|nr:hypothetical protein [Paracoccus siganidrum]RJL09428.1 hypothetical protein D3P05_14885 [Paracoccus siganidrum]RMC39004.1 hypothetical protein C9E82_06640 [Paracoccus siganidrum]
MTAGAKTEDRDITAVPADEIADLLGVGVRRVRQMAEEGRLRRRGRGLFDVTHALCVSRAVIVLNQRVSRNCSADTLAAVGWLAGFIFKKPIPITAGDLDCWRDACARWNLTPDQAIGLLFAAAALLGDRAPKFDLAPEGR